MALTSKSNWVPRFGGPCKAGNYESCFLASLGNLTKADLTVFGMGGDGKEKEKEVLVWHTKTKQNEIALKGSRAGWLI